MIHSKTLKVSDAYIVETNLPNGIIGDHWFRIAVQQVLYLKYIILFLLAENVIYQKEIWNEENGYLVMLNGHQKHEISLD